MLYFLLVPLPFVPRRGILFFWKSDLNIKFWSGLVWSGFAIPFAFWQVERRLLQPLLVQPGYDFDVIAVSFHLSFYLYIYPLILSIHLSIFHLFTHLSICINFESLSVFFHMFLSTYMFLFTTNSLSFSFPLVFPSVKLSFNLHVSPPIYLLVLYHHFFPWHVSPSICILVLLSMHYSFVFLVIHLSYYERVSLSIFYLYFSEFIRLSIYNVSLCVFVSLLIDSFAFQLNVYFHVYSLVSLPTYLSFYLLSISY